MGAILKLGYSSVATFTYAGTGINGTVTVDDREVTISLDFSKVNYSKLPGNTSCLADGLHVHIHELWKQAGTEYIGSVACGEAYTGGHWDPYLACGPHSANVHCNKSNNVKTQCVSSSSAFDSNNKYACNKTNYAENPYVCEVADWSGKYGTLNVTKNITRLVAKSFWEVESADVIGKAVVFHCANTDDRAFCAKFDTSNETIEVVIDQTAKHDYLAAIFKDDNWVAGYFAAKASGDYDVGFNLYTLGGACHNYTYRIYDSWSSSETSLVGNSSCHAAVGSVWDPTVSCLHGSDSKFCAYTDYHICDDGNSSYSCDSEHRFSCAPSDLAGKYGKIGTRYGIHKFNGTDDLFPPLDKIYGKSLVLECGDYSSIVACAEIKNYTSQVFDISNRTKTSEGNFYHLNLLVFGVIGMAWLQLM